MAPINEKLLLEIEAFLADSGMGESYFGKKAAGNSELVARLRLNGRVWPETAARVRSFIKSERGRIRKRGHGDAPNERQAPTKKTASVARVTGGGA